MRFASDTGGTFTDLVVEDDDGRISMYKSPTVAGDPVQGVLGALQIAADEREITLSDLLGRGEMLIHGTTHAINAIITGRTAKTALIVTAGHRDMLVFREGGRPEPFNHTVSFPKPYIPRSLTFEAPGRIIYDGSVLEPLDEEAVKATLAKIKSAKVEAIAVCLLWSTINPDHELRVGALIRSLLPNLPYTLSHEINPTLREFRRASAAAIDASLKPLMGRYLSELEIRLSSAGFRGQVMVLTSSGGMMAATDIAHSPIKVINSGPSMAPISGRFYAGLEQQAEDIIVADTGGTTYDISLVREGVVPITRELWIGRPLLGHLVGYPSVEVKSVGAGGGSIAHVDNGGLLGVGPQSAGATPGPACYGRGGELPTVTDASVVLGYIDPDFFLGGSIRLDQAAALTSIETHIAGKLSIGAEEAAWRIVELATENMVQAIADLTVGQGIDPSNAVLIGGGGAAGLNSVFIARRLACRALIIPETGAALSAAGAMMSDLVADYAVSLSTSIARLNREKVADALSSLEAKARAFTLSATASSAGDPVLNFVAEARYAGQVWDIELPFDPSDLLNPNRLGIFRERFDALHHKIFAVQDNVSDVEIIGLRVTVRLPVRKHKEFLLPRLKTAHELPKSRSVYFHGEGWVTAPVQRWDQIRDSAEHSGPAIIESPFTTVVVDPASSYYRSEAGSIVIHI